MADRPPFVRRVLAPNPGPMTLDGTNTWILGDPTGTEWVVVDPGPLDDSHLAAVLAATDARIAVILLTHRHADHSAGAARLAARAGCAVRSVDPQLQVGSQGLRDGDVLAVGATRLTAYATPGHTSDSCCLLLQEPSGATRLLTGDTVLGRGTTVIAAPDGDLSAYFWTLDRLEALVADFAVAEVLPGHGPVVTDPAGWLAFYRRHRQERLDQVRAALEAGDRTPAQVVARVYADVDPTLWPAAEQSVTAQLAYLSGAGPN